MISVSWIRVCALALLVMLVVPAIAPVSGVMVSAAPTQVRQGEEVVVTMAGIRTGSTVVVTLTASGRSPQSPHLNLSGLHLPFTLADGRISVQGNGTGRIHGTISQGSEVWSRDSSSAAGRADLLSGKIDGGAYEVLQARGSTAEGVGFSSVTVTIQGTKYEDPNGPLSFVIADASSGSVALSVMLDGTTVLIEELTLIPSLPTVTPRPEETPMPTTMHPTPLPSAPGSYPLSIPGLSFYPTGSGTTVVLDRLTARGSGYQIAVEPSRIAIFGPGENLTISANGITETARTIRGEMVGIHLSGTGQSSEMSFGRTSVDFSTDLSHAPSGVDAGVAVSIVEGIPSKAFAAYQQAAAKERLVVRAAGATIIFSLRGVTETGHSELRLSIPTAWVESNGGIGAVRIGRISSDGSSAEILPTIYVSSNDGDSLAVEAISEKGLGTFGLFTVASASSPSIQEIPTTQEPPIVEAERVANQTISWAGSNVPMVIALAALFVIILMLWWTQKRR